MIVKDCYCMSKVSLLWYCGTWGLTERFFLPFLLFKMWGVTIEKVLSCIVSDVFVSYFLKQVLTIISYWNNILSVISIPFKLLHTQTQFANSTQTLSLSGAHRRYLCMFMFPPSPTPHCREKHNNCMQCGNVLVCGVCPRPGPISPADRNQDTDSGRAKYQKWLRRSFITLNLVWWRRIFFYTHPPARGRRKCRLE